jgi:hypothetical protein
MWLKYCSHPNRIKMKSTFLVFALAIYFIGLNSTSSSTSSAQLPPRIDPKASCYSILNIPTTASIQQIRYFTARILYIYTIVVTFSLYKNAYRKSFKKLAVKYHPDKLSSKLTQSELDRLKKDYETIDKAKDTCISNALRGPGSSSSYSSYPQSDQFGTGSAGTVRFSLSSWQEFWDQLRAQIPLGPLKDFVDVIPKKYEFWILGVKAYALIFIAFFSRYVSYLSIDSEQKWVN